MKKKRILLLITNLDFGGAQRVFHNLSLLLAQRYDVVECVFNTDSGNAFPSGNRLISLGVRAGSNLIDKAYCFLLRTRRLRKLKRDLCIDICISHLEGADLANVLSSSTDRTIAWVHGSKQHDQNITGLIGKLRHQFLIPYIYKTASLVVTVSRAISEELQKQYNVAPHKLRVSHNYFDIKAIRALSSQPLADKYDSVFRKPVLLFSGRLAEQKNPAGLLAWFASFQRKDAVTLVILGDGDQRNEALRLAKELGLLTYHPWGELSISQEYQVYFLGFQPNPYSFVARARLFLLPSKWEGFPMVIGEALACGVPIVASDCPTGPLELLTTLRESPANYPVYGDFGVLLPVPEPSAYGMWSNTISTMLDDRKLLEEYAAKGPIRADEFSQERNSHRIHELVDI